MLKVDMRVKSLHIYPVKSLAGIDVSESIIKTTGLLFDRNWMIVDKDGQFVTQRHVAKMSKIKTKLSDSVLTLSTPDGQECGVPIPLTALKPRNVTVWGSECLALDEGDLISDFLTDFLGIYRDGPLRMVRMNENFIRMVPKKKEHWPAANTWFADAYPFLVVSHESLVDLNARLLNQGSDELPMNRFRPNIVIEGLGAYCEDLNPLLKFSNGVELQLVSPCVRCKITTIDQKTGVASAEPLKIFSDYRRNPEGKGVVFGQNAILRSGSELKMTVGMIFSSLRENFNP
jgi:uncharacterized protein YcbX